MLRELAKTLGPGFWVVFAIGALLKLSLLGTLGYVAWHFVSKLW